MGNKLQKDYKIVYVSVRPDNKKIEHVCGFLHDDYDYMYAEKTYDKNYNIKDWKCSKRLDYKIVKEEYDNIIENLGNCTISEKNRKQFIQKDDIVTLSDFILKREKLNLHYYNHFDMCYIIYLEKYINEMQYYLITLYINYDSISIKSILIIEKYFDKTGFMDITNSYKDIIISNFPIHFGTIYNKEELYNTHLSFTEIIGEDKYKVLIEERKERTKEEKERKEKTELEYELSILKKYNKEIPPNYL